MTTLSLYRLAFPLSVLLVTVVFLSACSKEPRFDTVYTLIPPEDSEAGSCLNSCMAEEKSCKQTASQKEALCEIEYTKQDIAYTACVVTVPQDQSYKCSIPRSNSCNRNLIRDEEQCESAHRSCFAACGGEVQSKEVCVKNCDLLEQPPTSN